MKPIYLLLIIQTSIALSQSYQVGELWSKEHINKASQRSEIFKESVGEVGASATLFTSAK